MITLEECVAAFVEARSARPVWPGVAERFRPATIANGYQLQRAVHQRLGSQGVKRVGYKVGSTSPAGQRLFGLSEPIYAGIFDSTRADDLASS